MLEIKSNTFERRSGIQSPIKIEWKLNDPLNFVKFGNTSTPPPFQKKKNK